MNSIRTLFPILCFSLYACQAEQPDAPHEIKPLGDVKDFDFKSLLENNDFNADSYLRAAMVLQMMGRDEAFNKLKSLAEKDVRPSDRVSILCRMLFSKGNGSFRPPGLGAPHFIGGTKESDWPLLPIEIVNGIPFVIVMGHDVYGVPESSSDYLNYCIDKCKWSTTKFELKDRKAQQKALDKLLSSGKWKRRLADDKRQFLTRQIK